MAERAQPFMTQQRLAPECVLWTVIATNRCLFPSPITLTQKPCRCARGRHVESAINQSCQPLLSQPCHSLVLVTRTCPVARS